MGNDNKYLYGFLSVIILLLLFVVFKGDLQSYLQKQEVLKKNQIRSQEVLAKANTFNIATVMRDCFDDLADKSENAVSSEKCLNTMSSYDGKKGQWGSLISQNRDINCRDFANKNEAQDFYEYVSGEFAHGYYAYWSIYKDDPSKTTTLNRSSGFVFGSTNVFDGHCYYDPYGLDANHDCDACESIT